MKNKRHTLTLALAFAVGAATVHAATFTWSGTTSNVWATGTNWAGGTAPASSPATDVVFATNTGLGSGYSASFANSQTIGSLTVNVSQFSLIGTATRTLTVGGASTTGRITLGTELTTDSIIFTNGATPRLLVQFANDIVLKNGGTGLASFGNARLQNGSVSTTDGTIRFQGSGSWRFLTNSYLGKNINDATPPAHKLDLVLEAAEADSFTGTLRYSAATAMDVDNVRVNSGTFQLDNGSTVKVTGAVSVAGAGTFRGAGTVEGDVTVDGKLSTATDASVRSLTVNGDLTLGATAETTLRVFAGSADAINGLGFFTQGGSLLINVVAGEYAGVDLFEGFSSTGGAFSSVSVSGTALVLSGSEWRGVVNGYDWTFDAATGLLSSVQSSIPEPASAALLTALGVAGVVAVRRRGGR